MPIDFTPYRAVLLDLDGTIYHEEHPLPGAAAVVRRLRGEGRLFACLSNSTASPIRLVERLARMKIEVDPDQVYTAAAATADYVVETFGKPPGEAPRKARVFNLASEGIHEMLDGLVDWVRTGGEPCDAVISGPPTGTHATDERQRIALQLLRRGAALVGICADRVYPSPRGLEFGSGAMATFLAYAANTKPVFCGKPQKIFFEELCHRLKVSPGDCILIGDNLESDVLGAKAVGMKTVLTLTGVTRRRDLIHVASDLQPDMVVEDLTELI